MTEAPSPLSPDKFFRVQREIVSLLSKLDEAGRREIGLMIISPKDFENKSPWKRMRNSLIRQWVPQMRKPSRSLQVEEFLAQWNYYLKTYAERHKNFSILPARTDLECRLEEDPGRVPRDVLHRISRLNEYESLSNRQITTIVAGKDEIETDSAC